MKIPGAELVVFWRATEAVRLEIRKPLCNIDRISLLKLGTSSACQKMIVFDTYLEGLSQTSYIHYMDTITQLYASNIKFVEGGCEHILQWHNSLI